jgi:uridylate kinase
MSGEALLGSKAYGVDFNIINVIGMQIKELVELGVSIGIVIGGGNIFRGSTGEANHSIDRSTADYMGMLSTIINSMALQDGLGKVGLEVRVQSAINVGSIVEPFIKKRANLHLDKARVVIFAGGTGNPYFTTDTAGVLRAMEIGADILFKATKVDGIYDKDPIEYSDAKKYRSISYDDFLVKQLKVMDATAVTLCQENKLPILVFNLLVDGNMKRAVMGEDIGTIVQA